MNSYLKLFVDCLDKYRKLTDAEFGRLIRAALNYKSTGVEISLTGREELLWDGIKLEIDRDNIKYAEISNTRKEAGKLGGRPKKQTEAKKANGFSEKQNNLYKDKEEEKDEDKEKDKEINIRADAQTKINFGEFGNVKLTQEEYDKLINRFDNVLIASKIDSLDSNIQNKIKKYMDYKDHYATISNWCKKDTGGVQNGSYGASSGEYNQNSASGKTGEMAQEVRYGDDYC